MTTFLERTRFDLATAAVVAPLASYGLHRMFPVPNVGFLAVASLMNICALIVIRELSIMRTNKASSVNESTPETTKPSESVSSLSPYVFQRLCALLTFSAGALLPIFARFVGQRMGIQVPDYLQTIGYISLVGSAFWAAKSTIEIASYYKGYKPAII
jgi:hypothetical protein